MGKIYTVNLPDIGEGVAEGEIIEWLKQPNDLLKQDEPVVVVMTDKATVELPAPHPGRFVKSYYSVGQLAKTHHPLYDIELTEGVSSAPPEQKRSQPEAAAAAPAKSVVQAATAPPQASTKALAAPPARKLAKELGVDINQVPGTSPEGHVTTEDVVKFHGGRGGNIGSAPSLRLSDDKEIPIQGIRNLMAKKMRESKSIIPHFSYFEQVDATRLVQLRHSFKEEAAKQGIAVTYMPFIIRALSLSLLRFPIINSSVDDATNKILIHQHHHVGIAISSQHGLIVPVLKNVERLSMQETILAYDALKERALTSKLLPGDMKEATITVSNFGVLGGDGLWATPVINHPEVAILAIGRIHKQPVVKNDAIVIRDVLNLSWSFDHRIIDGDLAASFSHHFSTLLQNPAPLL